MPSTTAYERVVDRLAALGAVVRVVADGAMAQCPAHPDRNPSLHIARGDRGVVLTCHAGCSTVDICRALDLAETDLFDEPLPPRAPPSLTRLRTLPTPTPVAEYLYQDADGQPVLKVVRLQTMDVNGKVGKTFRQMTLTPSGWVPRIGDLEPPLYHLPEVIAAVHNGTPVFVVEGEKDADRLTGLGYVATTNPMGAGKWRPQHTDALKGASVMLVADDDPPGRRHALAVLRELEPVATVVVPLVPAEGCKDVSEHLDAGFTIPAQLRPVDLATGTTTTVATSSPAGRLILTPASAFRPLPVRWGWAGRIPLGELTLIPGREGVGKSLFLAWLAAQLTGGTLPGEFLGQARGVLYVASEDSWRYTITPRLIAAGADLDRVYRVDVAEVDAGRLLLPRDCDALAEAAEDVQAAAIMLDPILSLIDDQISVNQARELRLALEPLRRAAEQANVMVPALAHFNKMIDADVLSRIPGARAWAEVARAAIALVHDPDGEVYVLQQIKNNLGRLDLSHMTYTIEEVLIPTDEGDAPVGKLMFVGETDVDVNDLLGPQHRTRDTSELTKMLVDWVIGQSPHPVEVATVAAAFPAIKYDTVKRTLLRAANRGTLTRPSHGWYGAPI